MTPPITPENPNVAHIQALMEHQRFLISKLIDENIPSRLAKIEGLVEKDHYATPGQLEKRISDTFWKLCIVGLIGLGLLIAKDIFVKQDTIHAPETTLDIPL
ncbi:MAG: hypothetical protein M2R45_01251 [Verrucomicrobia subdivision 3 bacterium]|nr:hypothetical protein [Limisphaerales bacterium]MCS1415122.1 hypothetical protein [Limisphaerales bacterium]